jgi:hypothetical protein
MARERSRISAKADAGTVFTIVEVEHVVVHRPISGPVRQLPGSREYVLEDGRDVTPLPDGRYQIVDTGEVLTPMDVAPTRGIKS